MELCFVSVAEIAEEVGFPLAVREELRVDLIGVETGHGSAVEAECARRHDEVSAFERAVAEGGFFGQLLVSDKVLTHVGVRKEAGKFFEELGVKGDDDGSGSGHGLVDIEGCESRLEAGLSFGGGDEDESAGRGVGGGGAETGEMVSLAQELGGHGNGEPRSVGARFAKELIEGGVG